ncbi:hypothetical protein [Brevibacillus brevis]|uniref:hypothetical protein n=1 Tax=Brevibacillus brevis TaxID=1393 RepID=UPI00163D2B92|nr:hypothetical protein [Lysinibacillus sp. SDF0063]
MDKKFVVRGKTMKFTSTSPDNHGEEVSYKTYDEAKRVSEELKTVFPFEEFKVEEV